MKAMLRELRRDAPEKSARVIFLLSALTAIIAVGLICIFLFGNGITAIRKIGLGDFLLNSDWSPRDQPPSFGILAMVVGSLYITIGALLFGAPIGICTAIFLARFCPRWLYRFLKPAAELLAGIPSVVYGFFGMVVIVPWVRTSFGGNGSSILSASLLLALMVLPTIINIAEAALRAVPEEIYEGAIALGASHERAVFNTVLPAAKSGINAAIVLGVGRVIGETMAVNMVAGNQALLRAPWDFLRGVRTLTANVVIEMGYAEGLHREALIATGMMLFVFILLNNLLFSRLNRRTM